jgi:hypothetical protein
MVRATRACPQSASPWCILARQLERDGGDVRNMFSQALALGQLTSAAALADVFVCQAAYEKRTGTEAEVLAVVQSGLDKGKAFLTLLMLVGKSGDVSLRLEKFVLDWVRAQVDPLICRPKP